VTFMANPEPRLNHLYAVTGVAPSPHDARFLQVVFWVGLFGMLAWMVWSLRKFLVEHRGGSKQQPLRSLEKSPEQRYQHASEIKTEMETIARGPVERASQAMAPLAQETPTAEKSTPEPAGPPQTIRQFQTNDSTIAKDGVTIADDAWLIDVRRAQTIRLFEVPDPQAEQCQLTYRAKIKTEGLAGRAYLEMWCCLLGRGEFFSKGLHQTVSGTTDWASFEIPFFLKKGEKPDLIKLNLVVEGIGKVWLKDIELLKTPLGS
jgi:hypothetical protein